jgi:hypothetical protein
MDKNENLLIHRFLEGELKQDEKLLFKEQYESDIDFARDVKLMTDLEIFSGGLNHYSGRNKSGLLSQLRPFLKYAALIILIIGITIVFFLKKDKPPRIFTENIEQLKNEYTPGITLSDSKIDKIIQKADNFYSDAGYDSAAYYYALAYEKNPSYPGIDLSAGISYFFSGNTNKAIEFLHKVERSDGKQIFYTSRWYIAWLHIKQNEFDVAANIFEMLANGEKNEYKEKSKNVLQQLKKNNRISWK